jgi:pilus assembly protein FimV
MDMLTFDLSGIDLPAFNTAPTPAPVSVSAPDPLPVAAPAPAPAPVPAPEPIPVAEPTMMELDFDIPPTNVEDVLAGVAAAGADAPGDEALTQKIDLAAEFRDIGDDEGARSLLEEVMASGNAAQRARAQAMLNELS